jgi:branched-chain amino acid aminotransferase
VCSSDLGVPVEERKIGIQELADAYKAGKLEEAFGTGTAAVISPIGELRWGDLTMNINNNQIGEVSQRLYNQLTGIQHCAEEDKFGWVYEIQ